MEVYQDIAFQCSKRVTNTYSTSFAAGIRTLHRRIRKPIYAIYGFVRLADEIVDSFHDFDKRALLVQIRDETYKAIEQKISLNPIIHSFQVTVNRYKIEKELIDRFLQSMEMDLHQSAFSESEFREYILGSAEVVGLMCLRVFCDGDEKTYQALKPAAMKLGAAFQKVNFLRDLKNDHVYLGRAYFPHVDPKRLTDIQKREIESDIEADFELGFEGIRKLPRHARFGVYLAYIYYVALFNKIKRLPSSKILEQRVRIPNSRKAGLLAYSFVRHRLNLI